MLISRQKPIGFSKQERLLTGPLLVETHFVIGLLKTCKWVSNFRLLLSLPSLVFIVPVSHVSLQVSRAEIGSSAPIVTIPDKNKLSPEDAKY